MTATESHQIVPQRITCYRTAETMEIDGRLDERSWQHAPPSEPFVDIVTGEPAWYDTRVRMLWDDVNLYIGFSVEEPNVSAYLTERDSLIYEDNDVEVFIAGPDAYYEFEINAFNTIYEALWLWKDRHPDEPKGHRIRVIDGIGYRHPRGERWGLLDWDFPGVRHAVHIDGEVNSRKRTDRGWTVELAFPWAGMAAFGRDRPKEGDVWRIDCSRFQQYDRAGNRVDPSVAIGWTMNRHGHYDSHIPEVFPYVTFSGTSVDRL